MLNHHKKQIIINKRNIKINNKKLVIKKFPKKNKRSQKIREVEAKVIQKMFQNKQNIKMKIDKLIQKKTRNQKIQCKIKILYQN